MNYVNGKFKVNNESRMESPVMCGGGIVIAENMPPDGKIGM